MRRAVLRHQVYSQQEEKELAAISAACRKDVLGKAGELPVAESLTGLRRFVTYKHMAISSANPIAPAVKRPYL